MSLPVVFRPIAKLELDEAMAWYKNRKEGLEAEFKEAVDQTLDKIAATPLRFHPIGGEVRRALLRIPTKSDTCSNSNRTLIPIDVGQLSERSDALGLVIKKCPV